MADPRLISTTGKIYSNGVSYLFFLLMVVTPASAKRVDFDTCYANNVTKLNNNDTSDPLQNFMWDPTHTNLTNREQTFLSLEGCYTLCGHGFQLYSPEDLTLRVIVFFLLPVVSLVGRIGFASVYFSNKAWTILHLLGNPIDWTWSTLTRQERTRRNYHIALQIAPGASREVAAVWTAYDQWWQDPIKQFEKEIKTRKPLGRRREANERPQHGRSETFVSTHDGVVDRQSETAVPDILNQEEIWHIMTAASELAKNRHQNAIWSWIAIVVFLAALTGGYIHLATSQTNNDVGHSLAVMTLFFFLPFAVYITGNVGTFRDPDEVITALNSLHTKIPKLFPEPQLPIVDGERNPTTSFSVQEFSRQYEDVQSFGGINNWWRPDKHLNEGNKSCDRSQGLLFFQSFVAVTVAWLSAFLLSSFRPIWRWGLGCYSGSWTVIYLAWLVSAALDVIWHLVLVEQPWKKAEPGVRVQKAFTISKAKFLWRFGMVKNSVVIIGAIGLIVLSQIGYFKTCWCMAHQVIRPANDDVYIDLGPSTQGDRDRDWYLWILIPVVSLILIHTIIFWAGWEGEGGRLLYLRTKPERDAERRALRNIGQRLHPENGSENQHSAEIQRISPPSNNAETPFLITIEGQEFEARPRASQHDVGLSPRRAPPSPRLSPPRGPRRDSEGSAGSQASLSRSITPQTASRSTTALLSGPSRVSNAVG